MSGGAKEKGKRKWATGFPYKPHRLSPGGEIEEPMTPRRKLRSKGGVKR